VALMHVFACPHSWVAYGLAVIVPNVISPAGPSLQGCSQSGTRHSRVGKLDGLMSPWMYPWTCKLCSIHKMLWNCRRATGWLSPSWYIITLYVWNSPVRSHELLLHHHTSNVHDMHIAPLYYNVCPQNRRILSCDYLFFWQSVKPKLICWPSHKPTMWLCRGLLTAQKVACTHLMFFALD